MRRNDYDLIVIGGGSAGLTASGMGAALGAKTALIDPAPLGGECTWTGCIPSKSLLRAADVAHEVRNAAEFGLDASLHVDGRRVMDRVRKVRQEVYDDVDAPPNLARLGVRTFQAAARFLDPHTIALEGEAPERMRARWFVIASGSRPTRIDLGVGALDNETLWGIQELPARLGVVGAGPVGIETAQAFRRLGSEVTVVSTDARILPHDDEECAGIVHERLSREGVHFVLGRHVVAARRNESGITVELSGGVVLDADLLFAAVGRDARVDDLDVGKAGVSMREGLIAVDSRCRTSARHIYAAGDVATSHRFTHVAERMAYVAVMNAFAGYRVKCDPSEMTWVTFTDPELAQVGVSEAELRAQGKRYTISRFPFSRLDRARTDGRSDGLVKIVATPRGKILGASCVGPRAGEIIAELALARKHGVTLSGISATLHPYPTYALAVRRAADAFVLRRRTWLVLFVLRLLRRLHGTPPSLEVLLS